MIAPIAIAIRLPPQISRATPTPPAATTQVDATNGSSGGAASIFEAMVSALTGQDTPAPKVTPEQVASKQPVPKAPEQSVGESACGTIGTLGPNKTEAPVSVKTAAVRRPAERATSKPAPPVQRDAPFVSVPIPVPAPPPPTPVSRQQEKNEGGDPPAPVAYAASPENAEQTPHSDVALQINIKMPNAVAEAAPPPRQQALPVIPEVAITPTAPAAAPPAVAAAGPTPVASPTTLPAPRFTEPTHAPVPPEPVERETPAQPLKSVTLDFAPDGASDVRLRVSERAGEVHISLHSTDASLSGKLHEGVHDLVGSLSRAGYDAEAWTPGQGHQGNQRQQEERKQPPASPQDPEAEEFAGVFEQQNLQENS